MRGVKDYLQSLGIMYIDWKLDNIGINNDSNLKLFDFDVSGMIDTNNGEWITKMAPPKYYSFNEAVKAGMITPIEIDNYAFELGFNSV
jgi:serine/threonine protein kinase